MTKIELKILDFVKKYLEYIVLAIFVAAAIVLRNCFFNHVTFDALEYMKWYKELDAAGGIAGLKESIGGYYVPYMYFLAIITYIPVDPLVLVKIVSVIFEFVCAVYAAKIIGLKSGKNTSIKWIVTFFAVLFNPVVIINGALWGQCDYIYTAFILMSIYYLLKENWKLAMIFIGVAFSFKLQAIFILPAYFLIYLLSKKFSLVQFLWVPLVYFISGLPAIIMGRNAIEVYTIYWTKQITPNLPLTSKCANIYSLIPNDRNFSAPGILITFMLIVLFAAILMIYEKKHTAEDYLFMILWINMTCVLFLPFMHERYIVVYHLLTIILYLFQKKKVWIPIVLTFTSLMTYFPFLYQQTPVDFKILAVIHLIVYFYITYDILNKIVFQREK